MNCKDWVKTGSTIKKNSDIQSLYDNYGNNGTGIFLVTK